MRVRNTKDFYAGLFFMVFGSIYLVGAFNYPMGTARDMGPGYFPTTLGGGILFLGFIIAAKSLWSREDKVQIRRLAPLLFVCGAVLAFAFMIQPLGLALAVLAIVFISRLPENFRVREVTILSVFLAALGVVLFIFGLGLPYKIFWNR